MSIPVDLGALGAEISKFDAGALLVTTSADGPPHVSSVLVTFDGDELEMGVGRKTRANAAAHPPVTLVWPAGAGADYCLIVDATARAGPDERLLARPTSAVLHRLASVSS